MPEVPLEQLRSLIEESGSSVDFRAGGPALPIRGVTLDSRQVRPGDLYAALPGAQVHVLEAGHFALDTAAEEIAQLIQRFMP